MLLLLGIFLSAGPNPAWAQEEEVTTETGVLNIAPEEETSASGLSVEVAFRDSTGDQALEPVEEGHLEITVTNQADGPATNVGVWAYATEGKNQVRLSDEGVGESAPEDLPEDAVRVGRIQELPADATQEVTARLRGAESLSGDPISLAVKLNDEHGFAPEKTWPLAVQTEEGTSEKESNRAPVVDRKIPETDMSRPDAIAVVIGVKEYEHSGVPNVDYAVRDAQTMKKYLTRTLGFQEENIIFEPNATGSVLQRLFGTAEDPAGQLHNWVKPGESEVFVYYSGHGAPDPSTGDAFLLGSDINPNYMSINGYPAEQLYENLGKIPAKSMTVVLDACFSGVAQDGPVVQRASPVELSVESPVMTMENGLAFTAGAADQIASWYPEKKHGLFTYFFLKGLRGEADQNGDQGVTAMEMEQYLTEKVPYRARRTFNREQIPQVVGTDKERVLAHYGAEE